MHPRDYKVQNSVRYYSDGMDKNYEPSLWTVIIARITLGLYIGVGHLHLLLFVAGFWQRYRWAWGVLAALVATLALPACPKRINSVTHSYLFLCWRRYFHFSYSFDESLDAYKDYVIAQFPHGAFPIGPLLCGTFMATEYPEYNVQALAAPSAFLVPIWRHVHAWLGTASCCPTNFRRLLGCGIHGPISQRGPTTAAAAPAAPPAAAAGVEAGTEEVVAQVIGPKTRGQQQKQQKQQAAAAAGRRAVGKQQQQQEMELAAKAAAAPAAISSGGPAVNSKLGRTSSEVPQTWFQSLFSLTPWQQLLDASQTYRDSWNSGLTGPSGKRTGISVGVLVGGIAEMFLLRQDCEQIKLLGRKGFVRIAVEAGTPILPVYIFGNSKVLSFGPAWLQRWSRKLRASLGLMYGVWGLPIPRRLPIYMAVGKPVPVPRRARSDPDFEAVVEEVHGAVVEAMKTVYYTHRGHYGHGYETRPLRVV
jgi:hypothetical protein